MTFPGVARPSTGETPVSIRATVMPLPVILSPAASCLPHASCTPRSLVRLNSDPASWSAFQEPVSFDAFSPSLVSSSPHLAPSHGELPPTGAAGTAAAAPAAGLALPRSPRPAPHPPPPHDSSASDSSSRIRPRDPLSSFLRRPWGSRRRNTISTQGSHPKMRYLPAPWREREGEELPDAISPHAEEFHDRPHIWVNGIARSVVYHAGA